MSHIEIRQSYLPFYLSTCLDLSLLSQDSWPPYLAGWWVKAKKHHQQLHVTFLSRDQVITWYMKKTSFHFHEVYGYQTWREVASNRTMLSTKSQILLIKCTHQVHVMAFEKGSPPLLVILRNSYVTNKIRYISIIFLQGSWYRWWIIQRVTTHKFTCFFDHGIICCLMKIRKTFISKAKRNNNSISARERKKLNTKLYTFSSYCYALKYFVGIFSININMLYDKVTFSFPSII